MVFQCSWDGTGRVYISGNHSAITGVHADDGYTVTIQPSGAIFDAPDHTATRHPAVELTSGMSPGVNTFTLVVQNWNGLSMSYGKLPDSGWQTPYIIRVTDPQPPGALHADFAAEPQSGRSPLEVQFTDISTTDDGEITGRSWFFGDETYSQPWTLLNASAGWTGRSGPASVVMPDGRIVIMGGASSGDDNNDVWQSLDSGSTWTLVNASAGWSKRTYAASAALPDGSIVLTGGYPGLSDTWRSSDSGETWTRVNASSGWSGRLDHTMVVLPDSSILLMGGHNYGNAFNDVWRSTDRGTTWLPVTTSAGWSPRAGHCSVVLPDSSIVVVGRTGETSFNDVWRSVDDGITWTLMNASAIPGARYGPSCSASPDGHIILTGGMDTNYHYNNDVWISGDAGATWRIVNGGPGWSGREGHETLAMPDGSIILMAGMPDGDNLNDVWRLDPAGSSEQDPSHTYTGPGVYTVALQAYNAGGYNSTVRRDYITVTGGPVPLADFTGDPREGKVPLTVAFTDKSINSPTGRVWFFGDETYTQHWTLINASAGWPGRASHGSVVMPDGSIVIMGGVDREDTWRSTDNGATWMLMNASSGWSGRYLSGNVVMTGGNIVLIGGNSKGHSMNDVWKSSDNGATWTQQTAGAEWSKRNDPSSVAMPDGSIILTGGGGNNPSSSPVNDVWRSTDYGATWTLVNGSAGWAGREGHASVVMPDSSIILMGGNGGSANLNDVWRSKDYGQTWTIVNSSAGWSPRTGHSCVVMPDGSIVLMGSGSGTRDIWRSADYGATWTRLPDVDWTARYAFGSVVMPDGSIVLTGGWEPDMSLDTDVWRFQPAGSVADNPSHTYTRPGTYPVTLQVYNDNGWNMTRRDEYVHATGRPADSVGVFRPLTNRFLLKDGSWTNTINWGRSTDIPVAGDWNGDGLTDVGVFRPSAHTFYLKNGSMTSSVNWGSATDIPITGDWNGDGLTDVGVFRPSMHTFYLKNSSLTTSVNWGSATDIPIAGDWNGDGLTDVGVFRPLTHTFYLKNGSVTTRTNWGIATDVPITGDWNGDGLTDVGVFRPPMHTFYLKNGSMTTSVNWGSATDIPVTGKWS
jgi:PKD repeat protein